MIERLLDTARHLVQGKPPTDRPASLDAIPLLGLDGTALDHASLAGKVLLFVNVASRCGLTPQYTALAALQEKYRDAGLVIVGVPCNQFGGQEPGSAKEIESFCSLTYGVDFPLLAKQEVNGPRRSDLYRWLVGSEAGRGADIKWNFEKFLVGRTGEVIARFSPQVLPDAWEVVGELEAALRT